MDRAAVEEAMAGLRTLVQEEGASFELVGVDTAERAVTLALDLDGVECAECVMPRQYLEALSLDVLRRTVPELQTVSVRDPREPAGG